MQGWPFADRIQLYLSEDGRHLGASDVDWLTDQTRVYICGLREYMDSVRSWAVAAGADQCNVHVEHFGAEIDVNGDAFELVAARSGQTMQVQPNQTMVAALRAAGIEVETGCQNGVCGTCLTRVIAGRPDHRDMVLTEAEKADGRWVTVCCSRSRTSQLTLDL